jgi:hypothetical protein
MSPDQQHRCTVQVTGAGAPFLAFEPSSGEKSSYSNSLFTLDLRAGASGLEAQELADHINSVVWGVSTTVF